MASSASGPAGLAAVSEFAASLGQNPFYAGYSEAYLGAAASANSGFLAASTLAQPSSNIEQTVSLTFLF
ncbi:unnamed protein product, partial [Mesorhabditis spiculigera]